MNVASNSSFAAGHLQHKLNFILVFSYPVLEERLPAIKRPQAEECCVIGCKYYLWFCLPAINPLQRFSSPHLCLIAFLSCFVVFHQLEAWNYLNDSQSLHYANERI